MTLVSVDKELAEELVDERLYNIQKIVNKILSKWSSKSAEQLIADARQGKIEEAEEDAISLANLLDRRDELIQLKNSWS